MPWTVSSLMQCLNCKISSLEGGRKGQVMSSIARISPKSGPLLTSHPAAEEIVEARNVM